MCVKIHTLLLINRPMPKITLAAIKNCFAKYLQKSQIIVTYLHIHTYIPLAIGIISYKVKSGKCVFGGSASSAITRFLSALEMCCILVNVRNASRAPFS
jgi:hypothetical protein